MDFNNFLNVKIEKEIVCEREREREEVKQNKAES